MNKEGEVTNSAAQNLAAQNSAAQNPETFPRAADAANVTAPPPLI